MAQNSADSLRLELNKKINSIAKKIETDYAANKPSTRGYDPCQADLERLTSLSDQLLIAYKNCCNNTPSNYNLISIYSELNILINNKDCVWDDHPVMYLVFIAKMLQLSNSMDAIPCARKCECGSCQ